MSGSYIDQSQIVLEQQRKKRQMTNNKQQIRKVIFVASGNKKGGNVTSFVRSQFESLQAAGLDMLLLPVSGHGLKGYLQAAWQLRVLVRKEQPDVIHAHYSICGYVAWLACLGLRNKPKIVVSILGSFPTRNRKWKLVRYCVQHLWDATIVKSNRTASQLDLPVHIIPNGVNLDTFQLIDFVEARKAVGFDTNDKLQTTNNKYVIWCSNPSRPEKNYALAEEAVKQLNITHQTSNIILVPVYDKTPQEVCMYMNAADCLLLTSVSEGSPNVIKEAMACNCPIVTTNVGDVTERLENLEGCYVVPDNELKSERVRELGEAIAKALTFGKRTEGRNRLLHDQLEISQIAKRIMEVYNE